MMILRIILMMFVASLTIKSSPEAIFSEVEKGGVGLGAGHLVALDVLAKRRGYETIIRVIRKGEAFQVCTGNVFVGKKSFDSPSAFQLYKTKAVIRNSQVIGFMNSGWVYECNKDKKVDLKVKSRVEKFLELVKLHEGTDDRVKWEDADDGHFPIMVIESFTRKNGYAQAVLRDTITPIDGLKDETGAIMVKGS